MRWVSANYELECTGDAHRASELLRDVQFDTEESGILVTARIAAFLERDYRRNLELLKVPQPGTNPFNPIFDQLYQTEPLRYLGREEDAVATLDAVGEMLAALEREDAPDVGQATYAYAKALYYSLQGNAEATRYWVEESRRRFRSEDKGDQADEAWNHLGYARHLARAELHKEAIEELRVMFEEPGGHGFRYVDAWPQFDALKNQPDYIELRERFGDAR